MLESAQLHHRHTAHLSAGTQGEGGCKHTQDRPACSCLTSPTISGHKGRASCHVTRRTSFHSCQWRSGCGLGLMGPSLCRKEQNPRSPSQKFINFVFQIAPDYIPVQKDSLCCWRQQSRDLPLGMMRCIATDRKKMESL